MVAGMAEGAVAPARPAATISKATSCEPHSSLLIAVANSWEAITALPEMIVVTTMAVVEMTTVAKGVALLAAFLKEATNVPAVVKVAMAATTTMTAHLVDMAIREAMIDPVEAKEAMGVTTMMTVLKEVQAATVVSQIDMVLPDSHTQALSLVWGPRLITPRLLPATMGHIAPASRLVATAVAAMTLMMTKC